MNAESGIKTGQPIPTRIMVVSILSVIIWAVLIMVYALLWSRRYNLFQNVVVFLVSLILTGLVIGLVWVIWGQMDSTDHKG